MMIRNWFRKLKRLTGADAREQITQDITDLTAEQQQLQHLQQCWESGQLIELVIGPPGFPAQQIRVITDCSADDAYLVSAPLNQLSEQNKQMLAALTSPNLFTSR